MAGRGANGGYAEARGRGSTVLPKIYGFTLFVWWACWLLCVVAGHSVWSDWSCFTEGGGEEEPVPQCR